MRDQLSYRVVYDEGADVLYVSAPEMPAQRGIEDDKGIIWRFDAQDRLVGATVVGMKDRWRDNRPGLTRALTRLVGKQNAATHVANAFAGV